MDGARRRARFVQHVSSAAVIGMGVNNVLNRRDEIPVCASAKLRAVWPWCRDDRRFSMLVAPAEYEVSFAFGQGGATLTRVEYA
jgi:hypothetical protein